MSSFYLHQDSLVRANNKLIKIKDLEKEMAVQSFVENDRLFYHGLVDGVFFKQDCRFVSVKAGKREIILTDNTPMVTSKGDGYVWRPVSEFKKGALMLIQNLTSTVTFHEPIIEIEDAGTGPGAMISLSRYENFVAEGFPIHTRPLPHQRKSEFSF